MFHVKEIYHGSHGILKLSRVAKTATFKGKTSGFAVKYVKQGREEYYYNRQHISLAPGHFLLLPADERYSAVHPQGQSVTEGVCIDLPLELPFELTKELLFGHAFTAKPAGMNSLFPENPAAIAPSEDQLLTLQREIIAFAKQSKLISDRLRKEVKNIHTQQHLINLLLTTETFLIDHCSTALTLDGIAREVGLSKFHLSRLYKKAFGSTVQSRQRSLRLEKAADKIQGGNTPIKQLAYSLGYSSPAAFSRQFRQHYGCSPTEWRQQGED
ncbi:MAG: AraC family transcriptional regulator [Bacteroidota bacterium]